jgi:Copper binding proteins, plastocyanin/azurin family.
VAANVAFDTNCLAVAAGKPFKIVLDNQDAGVPHNVAIYTDSSASTALFTGDLVTGPKSFTYKVAALDPGTYVFRCDVHPTTMTGTFIVK